MNLNFQDTPDWAANAGVEAAFDELTEKMTAKRRPNSTPESPAFGLPAAINWRIPVTCRPYGGWGFWELSRTYLQWLSYNMSQGHLLEGEWKPLAEAMRYWAPDWMPGNQTRAREAARRHKGPPRPTPEELHEANLAKLRTMFSLDPEDFVFPNKHKFGHRRVNQLTAQEKNTLVRWYENGSLCRHLRTHYSDCVEAMEAEGLIPQY